MSLFDRSSVDVCLFIFVCCSYLFLCLFTVTSAFLPATGLQHTQMGGLLVQIPGLNTASTVACYTNKLAQQKTQLTVLQCSQTEDRQEGHTLFYVLYQF